MLKHWKKSKNVVTPNNRDAYIVIIINSSMIYAFRIFVMSLNSRSEKFINKLTVCKNNL